MLMSCRLALALWSWGAPIVTLPRPNPSGFSSFHSHWSRSLQFRLLLSLMIDGYERVAAAHRAWWLAVYRGGVLDFSGLLTAMIRMGSSRTDAKARSLAAAIAVIATLGSPMLLLQRISFSSGFATNALTKRWSRRGETRAGFDVSRPPGSCWR